jgi:hypothetical protein
MCVGGEGKIDEEDGYSDDYYEFSPNFEPIGDVGQYVPQRKPPELIFDDPNI